MTLTYEDIALNVVYNLLVMISMAFFITWTALNKKVYDASDITFLVLSLIAFLGTFTIYTDDYNIGYGSHYLLTAILVVWLFMDTIKESNCNPMAKNKRYKYWAFGLGLGALTPIIYKSLVE